MESIISILERLPPVPTNTYNPIDAKYTEFQQRPEYTRTYVKFSSQQKPLQAQQQPFTPKHQPIIEKRSQQPPLHRGTIPNIFYRKTFLGVLLPLIDNMCLMYTETMLREYEDEFKNMLFRHLKMRSGPINMYIGRVKSKRLVAYLEDPNSRSNKELGVPLDIMTSLVEFLFDKPCTIHMVDYKPQDGSDRIDIQMVNPNRFGLRCTNMI